MDKRSIITQAVLENSKGTGYLEMMTQFMQTDDPEEHKMQGMFNIFESTRSRWPPMSLDGSIKPQCKKGCAYCCHLNVDVLKPEIRFIWKKVTRYLDEDTIESIKQQAKVNYDTKHKSKTHDEMLEHRCVCPFLDKNTNACSIYEDRPLACRGMHSGDIQSCIDGMEGETTNMFWGAPYMISDDISSGAALGLTLKQDKFDRLSDKVSTQLETGILMQFEPNIEEHGEQFN